jgi:fumarylacetoacetate (FAA) hydrolase
MRLVTFKSSGASGGQEKIGIHQGELGRGSIIDVEAAAAVLSADLLGWRAPRDMVDLIRHEATAMPALRKIEDAFLAERLPANCVKAEADTRLLSPIPRPTSMRDGYAFRQHVEAARRNRGVPMIPEFDVFPIFYFTNHLAVTGPGELAVQKLAQEKLDFELEAAIVIGKGGRNIPSSKADEHIFGYMIMNDWSARWLQMEEMKLNLGPAKGKDFATSLGPYLVTRDELAKHAIPGPKGERHDLPMSCDVNGVRVSTGNLKDMTWTFAQIVERASYGVELHPGEVIGSGTVGTVCFLDLNGSKITDNQWLKPGDEVVLEIGALGRLVNTIRAAEPTPLDESLPK